MRQYKIATIGLGYVGLPLATEFAKKYAVIGFDINESRVRDLRNGNDSTLEVCSHTLLDVLKKENDDATGLFVTNVPDDLRTANFFIITVPTPVDRYNRPDLTPLIKASTTIGGILKKGDIVVYESTVYPGVTEDECVPILERE